MVQHWKSEAARVQKLTKHGNRLALVMNRPVLELPKIECYPCHRFGPTRDPGLKARELCEAQLRVPHGTGLDLAGTLA